MIFVFGSNTAGRHGAGAARHAAEFYGAKEKVGEGLTGECYALPTKDNKIKTLSLDKIKDSVNRFLDVARENPDKQFMVTRVGCGLAGYKNQQIAELFKDAPENCILPGVWQDILKIKKHHILVVADPENLMEPIPHVDGMMVVVAEEQIKSEALFANNILIKLPLQKDRFKHAAVLSRNLNMLWMANQVLQVGEENTVLKNEALGSGIDVITSLDALRKGNDIKPTVNENAVESFTKKKPTLKL